MCRPTASLESAGNSNSTLKVPPTAKKIPNKEEDGRSWSLRRLSPLLVISLVPFLPTWCYINRGFTQWFHWVAVLYVLTKWDFLERFQVTTGMSICLGWYSALGYSAIQYGHFCWTLYQNMPGAMKDHIFHPQTGEIQYHSTKALQMMALSHTLDILLHPLLTYYFWRRHKQRGGTAADIFLSWPVIVSSYLYSRLWSMTQNMYNTGKPGFFYIGHDIYIMEHLDCWIPAYAAESLFYACLVLYKVTFQASKASTTKTIDDDSIYEPPPKLAYSVSGISRTSSMESLATLSSKQREMFALRNVKTSSTMGTDWSRM